MSGCDRLAEVHLFHDGELPPAEAQRVADHARACEACAGELGRLRAMSEALAGVAVMPPEALERVRRATGQARYAEVARLLRRLSAAAAIVLVGGLALLVWPRQRDVRGERRVFVWERAAVGDRPAAASQPSAEQLQLAQWIVNDLTPKVGP